MLVSAASATTSSAAQVGELGLAFVLSALIGLERELRHKPAGLRTLTVVGLASALFVQISKYGFFDVVGPDVHIDPSRVAAQVVSGLGFLGAGLIFVRRDRVRGLTTAAALWLVSAVGMAAGAGLVLLAVVVTAGHFVIACAFTPVVHRLSGELRGVHHLRLTYRDGEGVLRRALAECTGRGFTVRELTAGEPDEDAGGRATVTRLVLVRLTVEGRGDPTGLAVRLADVDGVLEVTAGDVDEEGD
ncbi:MAG: magnesium transporter MgtC [Frankiales bacterium]|nr:magnesium transporter MgtC [Frankiales bacterium]